MISNDRVTAYNGLSASKLAINEKDSTISVYKNELKNCSNTNNDLVTQNDKIKKQNKIFKVTTIIGGILIILLIL